MAVALTVGKKVDLVLAANHRRQAERLRLHPLVRERRLAEIRRVEERTLRLVIELAGRAAVVAPFPERSVEPYPVLENRTAQVRTGIVDIVDAGDRQQAARTQ